MSTNDLNYPKVSHNHNRKRSSFWNAMGMDVGSHREVAELSDTLFQAPVARYEEGFVRNKYGTGETAQGKLSLRAAERIGF